MESFGAEFFRTNRQKLTTLFPGKATVVLTANGTLQRNGDTNYPFRQDSSFWYFTGIDLPDLVLVIDKSGEYLILPERSEVSLIFDGDSDKDKLKAQSGINEILNAKDGWRKLGNRLKKSAHVATLAPPPAVVESMGLYTNPARAALIAKLKAHNDSLELLDLRPHVAKLRAIKQPQELASMQAAIDISCKGISRIAKNFGKYTNESKISAELTNYFLKHQSVHAYQPIVAAGANACTLHYVDNNQAVGKGPVLIDAGAEYHHYAADISRTLFTAEPTKRQRSVFEAVQSAHDFALSQIKPEVKWKSYEKNVRDFMGEKLRELGLVKTVDKENIREYFPHATSHFLGLDVHDVGDHDGIMEAGMTLTVEPGIYIKQESLGIRLEDDVLVTTDGVEVLSKSLPLTLN